MTALDAMRMAVEALQSGIDHRKRFEIVTALRAAIDEYEKAAPVAWIDGAELRAVMNGNNDVWVHAENQGRMIPLYLHPGAPQVDPNFPFGDEVFIKDDKGD